MSLNTRKLIGRELDRFDVFVITAMLITILVFSYANYLYYHALIGVWDNAVFVNTLWQTINGRILYVSMAGGLNILANHMTPELIIAVPFFAISPTLLTLLLLHVVTTVLAAVPFYIFARHKLGTAAGSLIAVSFLAYPYTQANIAFYFEGELFLMLSTFAAWLFLERDNKKAFFVSLFTLLLVKEDVALIGVTVGLFILIFKRDKILGAITFGISSAYFLSLYLIAFPALRQTITGRVPEWGTVITNFYSHLGSNLPEIAWNIISNPLSTISLLVSPENVFYIFKLFAPIGFVSLLSPQIVLIATPAFLETMLSNINFMHNPAVRYSHPIVPIIFISSVYGILYLKHKLKLDNRKVIAICIIVLILSSIASVILWKKNKDNEYIYDKMLNQTHAQIAWEEVFPLIPENASIATQEHLLYALANRENISRVTGEFWAKRGWPLYEYDYILLDTSDWHYAFPASLADLINYKARLEAYGSYNIIFNRDGYTLYKKSSFTYVPDPRYDWIELESTKTTLQKTTSVLSSVN